ncbi:hypothetical protein FRC03_002302 [Tulasnella sp. 419]|nr:hypothetical protein FRC03_002302 [Tulasnella sp. 419]
MRSPVMVWTVEAHLLYRCGGRASEEADGRIGASSSSATAGLPASFHSTPAGPELISAATLALMYNPAASGVAYPPRSQLAGSSGMPVPHISPTAGSLSGSLPHDAASYSVDGLHVSLLLPDDAPTPTQSSRSTPSCAELSGDATSKWHNNDKM